MNLEELKAKVREVNDYEWCGKKVWLRKIGASDGVLLNRIIRGKVVDVANGTPDEASTVDYHATLISKSYANEAGDLIWDTEEAREVLRQLNPVDLFELGDLVLKHSNYGEKKS